jgi:hypothetical protein
MAYDSNGVFSLTYTWATEAASPPIAISKLDTEMAGIATGLSLAILRNGNGKPTANIDWNDKKITNLANATADADALNRITADGRYATLAGPTFTGAVTAVDYVRVNGTSPSLLFYNSDADSDEKYAGWNASTGGVALKTFTDAGAEGATAIAVNRSGTAISSIALTATAVTVNGDAVHTAGTFVAPSSGTFTIYLRAANDGANLASGTATWKKFNGVVTLRIPELLTTNTTTTLVLDGLPADIQSAAGDTQDFIVRGMNNAALTLLALRVFTGTDYFSLTVYDGTGFNGAAANKGLQDLTTITYMV